MQRQTASCLRSSLQGAAFQTVMARDSRGLVYRVRQEIMTQRRLQQTTFPPTRPVLRGHIRNSQTIQTMTSRLLYSKVPA